MCRKITFLARAFRWPARGARTSVASSAGTSCPSSQPRASEPRPMDVPWRIARRVRANFGFWILDFGLERISALGDCFVEVQQHVGDVEPGGPKGGGCAGW